MGQEGVDDGGVPINNSCIAHPWIKFIIHGTSREKSVRIVPNKAPTGNRAGDRRLSLNRGQTVAKGTV